MGGGSTGLRSEQWVSQSTTFTCSWRTFLFTYGDSCILRSLPDDELAVVADEELHG